MLFITYVNTESPLKKCPEMKKILKKYQQYRSRSIHHMDIPSHTDRRKNKNNFYRGPDCGDGADFTVQI